jgi:hypothetical protein
MMLAVLPLPDAVHPLGLWNRDWATFTGPSHGFFPDVFFYDKTLEF